MWALFLRWGLEVGGLSSPSCLCQGGLVCLILGPIERPVWLSRKAVFCSPNQPLAAPVVTCWPPPAAPLSYFLVGSELGWRRGKLFLGLVKDPLPFIQTLHTNHLLCACLVLGTTHKAVMLLSTLPGLHAGLRLLVNDDHMGKIHTYTQILSFANDFRGLLGFLEGHPWAAMGP